MNPLAQRIIAVTGATGQQGGAVARHLLDAGWSVRALTRNAGSAGAQALAARGAQVVRADLNDAASLDAALSGVYGVFSVQNYYEPGVGLDGEIAQGCRLADAAARAGVRHFVQSTMAQAIDADDVAHFASKRAIERHLTALQLPVSTLGTVWFMDNLLNAKMGGKRSFDVLQGTLGHNRPFEMLAVDDIGGLAAAMFARPDDWIGKHLDAAGDRLTVAQMRDVFFSVLGRSPMRWSLPVPNAVLRWMNADFAAQLRWHRRQGWCFDLQAARELYPQMTSLRVFLERHQSQL
jgi:uncharacterized protein YbjT (DUF2867 family)